MMEDDSAINFAASIQDLPDNMIDSNEDLLPEDTINADLMTPILGLPLPNSILRALNQQGCVYLEDIDDKKLESLGAKTKDILVKTGKSVKTVEFISGDKSRKVD